MKQLGLDYTFAYCWYVANSPTPRQAIEAQMQSIRATEQLNILPQVVTVSQGWSGWHDEGSIWKIPPAEYETLLRRAKDFVGTLPADQLGSKMLLLDNWNEWGEGHYIAPHREFGFGYLDAVRKVFSTAPEPHQDLLPEEVGLGPYDTAYRAHLEREQRLERMAAEKRLKAAAPGAGLVGWWAFDEPDDYPVALDYSGNGLGGQLHGATRTEGIDGKALVCQGGCVAVTDNRLLSPDSAFTITCWVKTDTAGQNDKWIVNRIFGGGTSSGFRLGLSNGIPCFSVPLTDWSHHLQVTEPLPIGRWVHLAGTCDGQTIKLYVDGREQGRMERLGPVHSNASHLCLGSYEVGHAAHFTGLLDEVKLYARALTDDEIQSQCTSLGDQ
jgi:hypothetical protein